MKFVEPYRCGSWAITVSGPTATPTPTFWDLSSSTKAASSTTANPGDILTYTITIVNTGNGVASGVRMTDRVPANTTYAEGSVTSTTGTSASFGTAWYDQGNNSVFWNGTVAAGDLVTITFRVTVNLVLDDNTSAIRREDDQ
ncbi:MAG: DUF11 domain-containing protein [Chloroflexi bacterium]|nr:DUF11 domain-containing protein [Chloroflexota bacterium]